MPAKRNASAGKKAGTKEPEAGTRRSTRGASSSTDSKPNAGNKRKASPSPSPAPKRAASAKKGRTVSPSPVPETRPARGRSAARKKEEPKPVEAKPTSRSASNQKGRVTRNVVQEVEKNTTETKSRSSSRGAKAPGTPKNSKAPKSKAVTPSPKVSTPKKKEETPKKKEETPKQKATPRGRSATPRQTKATPKKAEVAPKQKPTPKQKPSPKQKQQSPQKKQEPASKKETTKSTPVKNTKSPPTSSRSRRSRNTEPVEDESKVNTAEEKEEKAEKDIKDKSVEEGKEDVAEEDSKSDAVAKNTEGEVTEEGLDETDQTAEKIDTAEKEEEKDEEKIDEKEPVNEDDNVEKEDSVEKEDESIEEDQKTEEQTKDINEKSEGKSDETTQENPKLEEEEEEMETETIEDASDEKDSEEEKSKEMIENTETVKETVDEIDSQSLENDNKVEENVELNEAEEPAKENSTEANEVVTKEASINLIDDDSNEGVEDISEQSDDMPQKVIDLNEDSGEAIITQEEPAVINDLTNSDDVERGGAGDIEPKNKVSTVEEISDDDIEEIETVANNVQGNGATNTNAGNDEIEVIDFVSQEDKYVENCPTKRKFDDVETKEIDDTSPHKKVRLSATEDDIQENGSGTQGDLEKDYVVIEMGDVPASDSAEVQTSLPNPIFNRSFIPNPTFSGSSDNSKQFSLVSYNILADCHLFKNDYSFTESKYLQPEYRLKNVIGELKYLDSDIVCLQEVGPQFFNDQLLPSMKSLGYDGVHKKRNADYYDEGEATFYKTSRFTVVETQSTTFSQLLQKELEGIDPAIQEAVRTYTDLPDVVIVTKLQCKNTGREVTIGNVHINWGEMKMPDIQCVQIASAVKEIVSKASGDNFPHIICGDFNSPPMSPGYLVAKDGYPSGDETINTLMKIEGLELPDSKKASLVNSLWPAFQHTSSSLRSVYSEAQGYEPEISSYNRVMCDTVDYIFYSSVSLENVGVLQTASKERVMETGGIPNRFFPSDHISIKAVLSFK
ncbi:myb-like protein X isoform X2 [Ruditapes philippinarum]|uniref:myb-like protein X isoform X2 n=1 Tax=Ruditapes philippinarum TaxID=129788 RepID=UPI00295AB78A|nr:myb-like protein X isoform X2 [Ruditapes philippinarum]